MGLVVLKPPLCHALHLLRRNRSANVRLVANYSNVVHWRFQQFGRTRFSFSRTSGARGNTNHESRPEERVSLANIFLPTASGMNLSLGWLPSRDRSGRQILCLTRSPICFLFVSLSRCAPNLAGDASNGSWPNESRLEFGGIGGIIRGEGDRGRGMKYRIAMRAGAGFLVAGFGALYASATFPDTNERLRDLWTLVALTCPIATAGEALRH